MITGFDMLACRVGKAAACAVRLLAEVPAISRQRRAGVKGRGIGFGPLGDGRAFGCDGACPRCAAASRISEAGGTLSDLYDWRRMVDDIERFTRIVRRGTAALDVERCPSKFGTIKGKSADSSATHDHNPRTWYFNARFILSSRIPSFTFEECHKSGRSESDLFSRSLRLWMVRRRSSRGPARATATWTTTAS